MRKFKRLLAAVLTAALAASLAVLPAGAAGSFSDIGDQTTAVNADILRLMGVVSGTGDNRFNPGGTLTRAQFATMVVNFLQRGEDTPRYATRTIFSDVKSSHWARSYVNLAASIMIPDGSGAHARTRKSPWLRRLPSSSGPWAIPGTRRGRCGPRGTWTWPSRWG